MEWGMHVGDKWYVRTYLASVGMPEGKVKGPFHSVGSSTPSISATLGLPRTAPQQCIKLPYGDLVFQKRYFNLSFAGKNKRLVMIVPSLLRCETYIFHWHRVHVMKFSEFSNCTFSSLAHSPSHCGLCSSHHYLHQFELFDT